MDNRDYSKVPEETGFALTKILPNAVNGSFWGFTTMEEIKPHLDNIGKNPNVQAKRVAGGVILEINPKYLLSIVRAVDESLLTKRDLEVMSKYTAEAVVGFEKFLMNKAIKGYSGLVGVYSINDTPVISYKGTPYPAFRVDSATAITLLGKWGYSIRTEVGYVLASQAHTCTKKIYDGMLISPTNTGVFMSIKSTLSSEQAKALKKQLGY